MILFINLKTPIFYKTTKHQIELIYLNIHPQHNPVRVSNSDACVTGFSA
jgi:hypothetical protein